MEYLGIKEILVLATIAFFCAVGIIACGAVVIQLIGQVISSFC